MLVNADLSSQALVTPDMHQWVASPQPGIERVMLDRVGAETGRATSLVRYAPGSGFPAHQHPGGEEILVLSGTFCEGDAHYPAGWYLRNPPGSSHQPSSHDGTTIFVKLWQMSEGQTRRVRINTQDPAQWVQRGAGRSSCPLFSDASEQVSLERLPAGSRVLEAPTDGAEVLLLEGSLHDGTALQPQGSWIRLPGDEGRALVAGPAGATLYLKTGHLPGQTQPTQPGGSSR